MLTIGGQPQLASPMRLLEMLADRFGAFEAVANSTIKLARYAPADELLMDVQLAEAVLEFGSDIREAVATAEVWAESRLISRVDRPLWPSRPVIEKSTDEPAEVFEDLSHDHR